MYAICLIIKHLYMNRDFEYDPICDNIDTITEYVINVFCSEHRE